MEVEGLERPMPLNAEQLFWLVERGYVEMPALSRDEIRDKNKSDGLARLLTIGQTLWFIASSVTRVGQGLSITTLELTTVSFIIVLFGTSYCWLHKPSDVLRPVIIKCNSTISIIRNEAGYHDPEDYTTTPLDFINREDYVMDMIWKYYVGILYKMRIPLFSRPIKARPYDRNCNTDFLKTELDFELFAGVFIFAFSATTMCAWNFYFPTPVERLLWRCASAFTLIFGVVGGLYMWLWHLVLLDKHKAKQLPTSEASSMVSDQPKGAHNGVKSLFMKVRNLSTYEEPTSRLPLGVLAPVTAFCVLYCLSRAYILIEDVVSLRSLPASVYATVEWSQYIPHF
ncbi:hypothetical protein B0J14DRAFT_115384 [Halenospora varia]|nr:hypothetical protein B0J14DRAFT_115384 [Halenospora varia]